MCLPHYTLLANAKEFELGLSRCLVFTLCLMGACHDLNDRYWYLRGMTLLPGNYILKTIRPNGQDTLAYVHNHIRKWLVGVSSTRSNHAYICILLSVQKACQQDSSNSRKG